MWQARAHMRVTQMSLAHAFPETTLFVGPNQGSWRRECVICLSQRTNAHPSWSPHSKVPEMTAWESLDVIHPLSWDSVVLAQRGCNPLSDSSGNMPCQVMSCRQIRIPTPRMHTRAHTNTNSPKNVLILPFCQFPRKIQGKGPKKTKFRLLFLRSLVLRVCYSVGVWLRTKWH